MNSLVLDLQSEVLKNDCDILSALRKAHLIASKLKLIEFDEWILAELNGYQTNQDDIPNYRQVHGQVKAWNPYYGWVPVILQNSKLEDVLCNQKLGESIGEILELYDKSTGYITITFTADVANTLDLWSNAPFKTKYSLHVSKHLLKAIIDKVTNCLMEWTLKLEEKGILGENMTFNETETKSAKDIPQQINNYYGNVIQGNVNSSPIISGNNNNITYNASEVLEMVKEIQETLGKENLSKDDMDTAIEILNDISDKLNQNKKPNIIKSSLLGLKDFVLSVGASVTAALITSKIQELF